MSDTADPFGERIACPLRRVLGVLGAEVEFRSNDPRLIRLAEESFARLPRHRWGRRVRRLRIELCAVPAQPASRPLRTPRAPVLRAGAGCLLATVDESNFVIINAIGGEARVQVSRDRFEHPYHLRYELIELAALTLSTRAQQLIPLHAACIAKRGRGVLVMGKSGAGKSTLTLASMAAGLQVLAEDSVFVHPRSGRATGVASFVHLRRSAVPLVADPILRERIRASPVIRRRSGARKFRFDLRHWPAALAPAPVTLVGVIFLSERSSRGGAILRPVSPRVLSREMRREQPYAMRQEQWEEFERSLLARGGFRLLRGERPGEAVQVVRRLLAGVKSARNRP
jgi:hypothetical protein